MNTIVSWRRHRILGLVSGLIVLWLASAGFSQDTHSPVPHSSGASVQTTESHDADPHPTVPQQPSLWVGSMLIIVAAMFLMAVVIGPAVRAEMPDELPVPHAHGEVVGHEDHGEHEPGHGHGHH